MNFISESQLAVDSNDHLYPVGCINDNYNNPNLAEEIEKQFGNRKISFLDLGCAGGQFVIEFINRGHKGYGLEGSSHSIGGAGRNNWTEHKDKNLFLCDLTKPYHFEEDGKPFLFDFIHCSEVIEHILPKDLEKFFKYVSDNLSPDGIFCCQVNMTPDVRHVDGKDIVLHHSLFNSDEWKAKFINFELYPCAGKTDSNHFGYLFHHRFREHGDSSIYACLKK